MQCNWPARLAKQAEKGIQFTMRDNKSLQGSMGKMGCHRKLLPHLYTPILRYIILTVCQLAKLKKRYSAHSGVSVKMSPETITT